MAGLAKNLWLKRAIVEAEVLLADTGTREWLATFNIHNEEGYRALYEACKARKIPQPVITVLLYYNYHQAMPTQSVDIIPIKIWSPKHKMYGESRKNPMSHLYFFNEEIEGPSPREDRIYLALPPGTTRLDIDHFLDTRYKSDIEPLLADLGPKPRVRSSKKIIRDTKIRQEYTELKSYTKVANEHDITKRRVEQIVKDDDPSAK